MSIQIPADTTLRVNTNPDGSLTLHFDRKRPLDPETTPIEATEDADVTVAVADDAATTFTLKRHKTAVFRREDGPRQDARGIYRATTRERLLSSACLSSDARRSPGIDLLDAQRSTFSRLVRSVTASYPSPKRSTRRSPRSRWESWRA